MIQCIPSCSPLPRYCNILILIAVHTKKCKLWLVIEVKPAAVCLGCPRAAGSMYFPAQTIALLILQFSEQWHAPNYNSTVMHMPGIWLYFLPLWLLKVRKELLPSCFQCQPTTICIWMIVNTIQPVQSISTYCNFSLALANEVINEALLYWLSCVR